MGLTRRDVIGGVAAVLLADRANAQLVPLAEADQLTLLIVADGTAGRFAATVEQSNFTLIPPARLVDHRQSFKAEWGFGVLAERGSGRDRRRTLIDFGYSPDVLANNLKMLDIDPASIDDLMLSHGHYDHFGGLAGLLASGRLRRALPLHVGGEEAFCARVRGVTPDSPSFGALNRAELHRAGLRLIVSPEPQRLAAGGMTSGRIPFRSPERPRVPTAMLPGNGCEIGHLSPGKVGRPFVIDDAEHELAAIFPVRGQGLVVIGSCSHRGIINTVLRARAVSGEQRVLAIVGGFHLVAPQTEAQVNETVALMRDLDPRYVIPGHCSGESFFSAASVAMPGRLFRAPVGTRLIFRS